MTDKKSVYAIVTENVINLLKKGVVPWRKPWKCNGQGSPKNLNSKKEYRGINVWLLAYQGYASPYWLTFKQAKEKGGSVKKGEKGTIIVFWKPTKYTNKSGEEQSSMILRYYRVWNLEQCENVKDPDADKPKEVVKEFNPIERADDIIMGFTDKPPVRQGGDRACYYPDLDKISMPEKEQFNTEHNYYSTLFHEFVHSTGHEDRVGRGIKNYFGDKEYSKEELVAEMGATFLCALSGIEGDTQDISASYIAGWLEKLKSDDKFVIQASAQAQKAVDYMLGKKWSNDNKKGETTNG